MGKQRGKCGKGILSKGESMEKGTETQPSATNSLEWLELTSMWVISLPGTRAWRGGGGQIALQELAFHLAGNTSFLLSNGGGGNLHGA